MSTKPQIISVSRRTDIPAYFADWFRNRLEKGFTVYPNPMSQKPVYLDLKPTAVKAFVFWTRNPRPLLKHLDYIDDRYNKMHYMHVTINGLPELLEERNPKVSSVVKTVEEFCKRYGNEYVQWRFDPIVLSSISSEKYIIDTFTEIAVQLNGLTKRCYFSFVDFYQKTEKNFKRVTNNTGVEFFKTNLDEQIYLATNLSEIALANGIEMYACAEDQILERLPHIKKAHCVDADIIEKLTTNHKSKKYKYEPSRIGCGCFESKDIGYYNSCPHGCIYCYANMDPDLAFINAKKYLAEGFPLDTDVNNVGEENTDLFG